MIELSIIIPTYGRVEKIKRALESSISGGNIEVIVVDDNGKGNINQINTQRVLNEYILSGRIRYFALEENSGAGNARNYGVSKAKGKYITFLDDDDYFIDDQLDRKLAFFKQYNDDFDICCSHMYVEKSVEIGIASPSRTVSHFVGDSVKSFLLDGCCYTPMMMIKKNSFIKIGGFFDTPYLQDHTLMLKAYCNGLRVCVFDEVVFVHTLHAGDTITTGLRPICGEALRCQLEKELAKNVILYSFEKNRLLHRWNTISYHKMWLSKGRTLKLFYFLVRKILFQCLSVGEMKDSFKLLVKFFVKYQYYTK